MTRPGAALPEPVDPGGAGPWDSWASVVVRASPVGMGVLDEECRVVAGNPAFGRLLGRPVADLVGRLPRDFAHPGDLEGEGLRRWERAVRLGGNRVRVETRFVHPDGTQRWGWVAVAHLPGPEGREFALLSAYDTTERRAAEDVLVQEAVTDPLTGLLNRLGWRDRTATLGGSARGAVTIAVLDLDHFKAYNDSRGHQAGDRLLRSFAVAAAASLRPQDVLARWGGEEFALALPGIAGAEVAAVLAELARLVPDGQAFSAGHTVMGPGESVADTWDRADTLLYTAKRGGRARTATDQP